MTLNTSQHEIMTQRRERVARLRVRGLSIREIVAGLEQQGHVNPKSGKAWDVATIHTDIKAIDATWRAEMLRETDAHKSALLTEIREARRAAWAAKDLGAIYAGIKQERELLGLDAPKQYNVNLRQELEFVADALGQSITDVVREFEQIAGVKV
jgi:DNA-binding transcriptional MerR regulator